MTGYCWRAFASAESPARYASSASRLTRQTPLRPIFSAGSSPLRINVYTCDTVTLSTPATSEGFSSGGGRSSANVVPRRRSNRDVASRCVDQATESVGRRRVRVVR